MPSASQMHAPVAAMTAAMCYAARTQHRRCLLSQCPVQANVQEHAPLEGKGYRCVQVRERQAGRHVMVDSGGASRGGFDARKGQHEFSWRDAMDIPVRWRQLSEPNDQVSFDPR